MPKRKLMVDVLLESEQVDYIGWLARHWDQSVDETLRVLLTVGLRTVEQEEVCRVCGCSNSYACEEGCNWVEDNLCSTCAAKEDDA